MDRLLYPEKLIAQAIVKLLLKSRGKALRFHKEGFAEN
jgi:hypothetical protein